MKQFIMGTITLVLVSIISITRATAQPPFEVPLRVTDGWNTDTLYFGILPGADPCINWRDCLNGHCEILLPPPPPGGFFYARFIAPLGRPPVCYDQGSLCDYRPFTSAAQKDTFRVTTQLGGGTTMTLCWPDGLSRYFTALTICGIDALREPCFTYSGVPFAACTILSSGLVVSVEEGPRETLPEDFILHQNYPNPFNPSTRISFSIPHSSFVSLRVYDLLGREVATLVNEQLGTGNYERTFNAEGLTSGVYFYRLQAGGFVQTKKLLLLR
jgi:hypothetical protein